jgi:hypothetical protein
VNFTANDYGTGLHLAAGIVLALLARARGVAVTNVESSLMMTATVFQSEAGGAPGHARAAVWTTWERTSRGPLPCGTSTGPWTAG